MDVGQVKAHIIWAPLLTLCILYKLTLWTRASYARHKSLSTIPGPRWAAWTRLWIVKTLASGDCAQRFVEVNKQYGKLARIGPNHLISSDPAVARSILDTHSKYTRGPWFDCLKIDPNTANIVCERDAQKHNILRHELAPSYTSKSICDMEPLVDEQILRWFRYVDKSWTSNPGEHKPFDIARRIQYLTVDIITKLTLGKELGDVASDSDKFDYLHIVQQGNSIPCIGSLLISKPSDQSGIGKIMGIVRQTLETRVESGNTAQKDILGCIMQSSIPNHQIHAETVISLVAGSETTSTSIQSTLLAIILNPIVYQKLKTEIQDSIRKGIVSYPIQDSEARSLPYLTACALEGLRKHPPLSHLRERIVPPEGDVIQGHHIPGGTYVGLNAWGTQLDEIFGNDADIYRPERWLIDDEERLRAMHKTHELVFGYGSTKCLGKPIAMMELHKMIFELLRHFDITIANPYKPWSSVCYGMFFQKDLHVHLTRAVY